MNLSLVQKFWKNTFDKTANAAIFKRNTGSGFTDYVGFRVIFQRDSESEMVNTIDNANVEMLALFEDFTRLSIPTPVIGDRITVLGKTYTINEVDRTAYSAMGYTFAYKFQVAA